MCVNGSTTGWIEDELTGDMMTNVSEGPPVEGLLILVLFVVAFLLLILIVVQR